MTRVISCADHADRAGLYGRLGLTLTYDPHRKQVTAGARLALQVTPAAARPHAKPGSRWLLLSAELNLCPTSGKRRLRAPGAAQQPPRS